MMVIVTIGALFALLLLFYGDACQLPVQSTEVEGVVSKGIELAMASAGKLTLTVVPAQENNETSRAGVGKLADRRNGWNFNIESHANLPCKEFKDPRAFSFDSSTKTNSAGAAHIFEAILHDQHTLSSLSEFRNGSSTLHKCHFSEASNPVSADSEVEYWRVARLHSASTLMVAVDRIEGYGLAPPIICFFGSSVVRKVIKDAHNNQRGNHGKPVRSCMPFGFVASLPIFFAKGVQGLPLNGSLTSGPAQFFSPFQGQLRNSSWYESLDWKPLAFSVGADAMALGIGYGTGWPRTAALITVAIYVFVGLNILQFDQPDYWLGSIIWLNLFGFSILYSFLDIRALWERRVLQSYQGYGAYFFLVSIIATLIDITCASWVKDAMAFDKAMLYGSPTSWLLSSLVIGRTWDNDESQRNGELEADGEANAALLPPSQPDEQVEQPQPN